MNAPSRPNRKRYDYLIVGAGFAGSVLAERLASQHGARVLLIDRRRTSAATPMTSPTRPASSIHKYGPHIFHTNSDAGRRYLSQFTEWRPYEHRVLRRCAASWCRSRSTARRSTAVRLDLKTDEEAANISPRAPSRSRHPTSEDVVINAVGRELYELFFRGYTRKQWGLDPSELDKQVTSRIPTRTNTDDRYFTTRSRRCRSRLHGDVRADARPSR
jgi:UDP-galactopyranose mutase